MRTRALLLVLLATGAPLGAEAATIQPIPHLVAPLESGALQSALTAYFTFTMTSSKFDTDEVPSAVLTLNGQIELANRFELGVVLPLVQTTINSLGNEDIDGTGFGNAQLHTKLRLFGVSDYLVFSAYANGTLPTASADVPDRKFGGLQVGLAGTLDVAMFTLGANTGGYFFFDAGVDTHAYEASAYLAVNIGIITLQVQNQYIFRLDGGEPSDAPNYGKTTGITVTPVIGIRILGTAHVDVAARIAINEEGRQVTHGGRVNVMVGGGFDF